MKVNGSLRQMLKTGEGVSDGNDLQLQSNGTYHVAED
jgi:hypothetical protein